MGRLAVASPRPVSALIGVAGSSGAETIRGRSAIRAERCTILDLGIPCSRAAASAGVIYLLAQRKERGPGHIRAFAVVALLGAAVSRFGLGECASFLEQNTEIERRDRVAAFVGAPERRLGFR